MEETAKTLTCPECGAALEPPAGAETMKCGYCGTAVIIPPDLRPMPANRGGAPTLKLEFGQLLDKAIRMGAVMRLAEAGKREEAVHLYMENTGASAEQAGEIIDAIRTGDEETAARRMGVESPVAEALREATGARPRPRRSGSGCTGTLILLVLLVVVIAYYTNSLGSIGNILSRIGNLVH
jgi:phosphate uptake regulator